MTLLNNTHALLAGAGVVLSAACASTSITSSWKDPSAEPLKFDKVLVVFMSANSAIWRPAEDELVRLIERSEAVASYTMFPGDEGLDEARANAQIGDAGFDRAVVMRIIASDQQISYSPGMAYPAHYSTFYGYYGYGWPTVYQPGYLRSDTVVSVETNVYSVRDDKLLWSGVSETFNPNDAVGLVDDVARVVARELERQGLLP